MAGTDGIRAPDYAATIVAVLVGSCIAYVDSRASWDDTGVTVGALFALAAVLGAIRPRAWWLVGLAAGIPVVAFNVAIYGRFSSAIAVAFSLLGAVVGGSLGRRLRGAVA
jgi:hypothetical protein